MVKEIKKLACITNEVKWLEQIIGYQRVGTLSIKELAQNINNYFANVSVKIIDWRRFPLINHLMFRPFLLKRF